MNFAEANNDDNIIEAKIRALIVDPNSGTPVLILKDTNSDDMVPIWVGACEANAIAAAIENNVSPRPMTHDLLRNFISHVGLEVSRIVITTLKENTYYATIELLDNQGQGSFMDARPSDAIALALRAACPIMISKQIFAEQNQKNEEAETEKSAARQTHEEDWPDIISEGNDMSM